MELDLDALERDLRAYLNHSEGWEAIGDAGDIDIEEYLAVIQRLRKAEAEVATLTDSLEQASWDEMISNDMNSNEVKS